MVEMVGIWPESGSSSGSELIAGSHILEGPEY